MSDITFYGIRHHGPGSARSVLRALEQNPPDVLLVEGPPDAEAILPLLIHTDMKPPVALLVYASDNPAQAAYYPFVTFSPEYQAVRFALERGIPVRLMDLPQRHMIPLRPPEHHHETDAEAEKPAPLTDPLSELAQAAGYDDAERWWDAMVEQQPGSGDLFEAIHEAMRELRTALNIEFPGQVLREAYMRKIIAEAQNEYQRIAVVCGAWHTPGLRDVPYSAQDAELLANLAEVPVSATWLPWTFSRLSRFSGYGAGVTSPGWYRFLWESTDHAQLATGWLTKVAQHLREHDLDASTAQVIDGVRLVETLTMLRGRALPDLHDLNEAALSVLCHGNEAPMHIIHRDLIVGRAMGRVPPDVPMVPLQRDFHRLVDQFELELKEESDLLLDLRDEQHREISRFLCRMALLDVTLGSLDESDDLYEAWRLIWLPEQVVKLIEQSAWGNTVIEAATAFSLQRAREATALKDLTLLVRAVLMADLPDATAPVVGQLEAQAAVTGEVVELMAALPPLAEALTYGDVRRTQTPILRRVVDGMTTRILIGLPAECDSLDDDGAVKMLNAIIDCDVALRRLDAPDVLDEWRAVLNRIVDQSRVHGFIRGRCCRIVLDADFIDKPEAVRHLRLALARVVPPPESAAWLRGFLQDSGMVLVHDEMLLDVIDAWVSGLMVSDFEVILPLVRRTFSTFEDGEVRYIGRRLSGKPVKPPAPPKQIDKERAADVDAILSELLGLKGKADDE